MCSYIAYWFVGLGSCCFSCFCWCSSDLGCLFGWVVCCVLFVFLCSHLINSCLVKICLFYIVFTINWVFSCLTLLVKVNLVGRLFDLFVPVCFWWLFC